MQFSSHPTMAQVARLLAQCGLPSDDILPEHLPNFVLARDGESEVGVAGLQVLGSSGLVRSVAVLPSHRSRGLGTKLLAAVEDRAQGQGVKQLFLLTHDAQSFFLAHGYTESSRCSAPPEVQGCSQFGSSCCGAATLMCKRIEA
jgi:amino-acid N-acetyltransferase